MTGLSDAQIERYSRQIIMPEVGGRGQERLLAARIAVAGDGEAAAVAASLLARAGVGTLELIGTAGPVPEASPGCRVHAGATRDAATDATMLVDFTPDPTLAAQVAAARGRCVRAVVRGARAVVLTCVGRPCAVCAPQETLPLAAPHEPLDEPLGPAAALAVGAIAAGEALRLVLTPSATGRLHALDLAASTVASQPLVATAGCEVCGHTP